MTELLSLSNRRITEWRNCGVVKSSNGGMAELLMSNDRTVECSVAESSNGGMVAFLSNRRRVEEWSCCYRMAESLVYGIVFYLSFC
jgi:hypothetical protein